MATRSPIATDDFNRAGPALGANWAQNGNTLQCTLRIGGSDYYEPNAAVSDTNKGAARWVGAGSFTDNQYAVAVVENLSFLTNQHNVGVAVRMSGVDGTRTYYGYMVAMDGATNKTTTLFKNVNGTFTSLGSNSVAWANGDTIEIEAEGSTITGYRNGAQVIQVTGETSIATGVPGICGSGSVRGDDWIGGNLTTSSMLPDHNDGVTVAEGATPNLINMPKAFN